MQEDRQTQTYRRTADCNASPNYQGQGNEMTMANCTYTPHGTVKH